MHIDPFWIYVAVAAEILAVVLGLIIYLSYRLAVVSARWRALKLDAYTLAHDAAQAKRRLGQAQENLQRLRSKSPTEQPPRLNEQIQGFKSDIDAYAIREQQLKLSHAAEIKRLRQQIETLESEVSAEPAWPQPKNEAAVGGSMANHGAQGTTATEITGKRWSTSARRSKEELIRLQEVTRDQRCTINELREQLSQHVRSDERTDHGVDDDHVDRLERLLTESDEVIAKLESELSDMRAQIDDLERMLAHLDNTRTPDSTTDRESAEQGEVTAENNTAIGNLSAELAQLESQYEATNDMAMMMMRTCGDQSNIIDFARKIINCHTHEELANAVLECVQSFGVRGSVQIRGKTSTTNRSLDGNVSMEALAWLEDIGSDQRYEDLGDELLIRFEHVSLLLSRLPEDDEKFARVRDNLAIGLEISQAEIENIDAEHEIRDQQSMLKKLIKGTREALEGVENQIKSQSSQTREIVEELAEELTTPELAETLDSGTKTKILTLIRNTKRQLVTVSGQDSGVDKSFSQIIDRLSSKL